MEQTFSRLAFTSKISLASRWRAERMEFCPREIFMSFRISLTNYFCCTASIFKKRYFRTLSTLPSFLLINRSQPVFQIESIIHTFIIFHFNLNYSFLKQRYKNEQRSKFKPSADFWHNKDACNHLIPNNMFVGLNQLRKSSYTISMKFFCHVYSLKLLAVAQYNEI